MVKIMTLALAIGIVLYLFFDLPDILKRGPGARLRYIVFTVLALLLVAVLLKTFL